MGNGRNYYLKEEVKHVCKRALYGRYTTENRRREINETVRITITWRQCRRVK